MSEWDGSTDQPPEWTYRGPQGHLHLPRWNTNCYYKRESACALCVGRLIWGVIKTALRNRLSGGGR